jgi:hypothetical protein
MQEDGRVEGRYSENSRGLGTVTDKMVRERGREIAVINGRSANRPLDSDFEEAWRELTGRERLIPPAPREELLPEEDRWEVVAPSGEKEGLKIPVPDEQMFAEMLVEEGVEDAEHDEMLKAAKKMRRQDR